ncbi:MAG: hypothetical protein CME63_12080 [Halobacteriovoraceae bacterium]|nr:hypothetical protein [Halobacteriovoraceae bacterium]|tara:strand:- start:5654 stop:8029 length:2376 start_codon:yes stop_codon:yes gene_type:complete
MKVNLNVSRDNESLYQINFTQEIEDNNGAPLTFFVGRGGDCQVQLDDKQVSREHARIKFEHGDWSIEKVSSFNTISLNGSFCETAKLKNGDLITIGPFTLNVELDESVVIEPESVEEDPKDQDNEEGAATASGIDVGLGSDEATEILSSEQAEELNEPAHESEDTDDLEDNQDLDNGEFSDQEIQDSPSDYQAFDDNATSEFDSLEQPAENDDNFSVDGDDGFSDDDFSNDLGDGESDGFNDEFMDSDMDESYDMEAYDDDEKTQVIKSFASFSLELFGEYAPYDKFVIEKPETFIGRDPEKCDIVLNDPEVSGVHAVIKKNAITCTLEDLKSANGTILNGERVNSHDLTSEDEFIIGGTTFTVKIQSDFLQQEQSRIMPVEDNQVVEVEEIVEVDENFDGDFDDQDGEIIEGGQDFGGGFEEKNSSLFSKDALKDPEKRKKILYILVGLMALWVLLEEEEPKKPKIDPKAKEAAEAKQNQKVVPEAEKQLTPEQQEFVEGQYLLASQYFAEKKYSETIMELDKIFAITKEYKNARTLYGLAKEGLAELTKLLEEERKEKERKLRDLKVRELLEKAEAAVKEKKMDFAKNLFKEITRLDPENFDVTRLKLEVEAYEKEIERKRVEKAQKEAERKRQVQELAPGKSFYQRKDWYKAKLKLQDFLRLKGMDEDLVKDATRMLEESTRKLDSIVNPLLGKARSLKEGQDLKGAYELYLEILKYNPAHVESLNEMDEIRERLELRSKKVYREAIIAESLSLYDDAKEKFQEVQQISPTDSDYYKKATEKLKDYLD